MVRLNSGADMTNLTIEQVLERRRQDIAKAAREAVERYNRWLAESAKPSWDKNRRRRTGFGKTRAGGGAQAAIIV